jgi:molybdopterin/thiamine biosynthesis adenylyltransferase
MNNNNRNFSHIEAIHSCNSAAFGKGNLGINRQKKVYSLNILLNGFGSLGQLILGNLYGLGIKNISVRKNVFDKYKNSIFNTEKTKNDLDEITNNIVDELRLINPQCNLDLKNRELLDIDFKKNNFDIIIDTSYLISEKEKILKYSIQNNNSLISCFDNYSNFSLTCFWNPKNNTYSNDIINQLRIINKNNQLSKEELSYDEIKHNIIGNINYVKSNEIYRKENIESIIKKSFKKDGMRHSKKQEFINGICAGLVSEEVRKFCFAYEFNDSTLNSFVPILYNPLSEDRTSNTSKKFNSLYDKIKNPIEQITNNSLNNYKVLVVGCGALGNWVEHYLSDIFLKQVDFLDYDIVESKNLNRQIDLRGRIGDYKSVVLNEKFQEKNDKTKSSFINGKIGYDLDENYILDKKYDCILGCVDNKNARIWMNDFCLKNRIIYIDGGTGPREGQVAVYIPNKTKSIDEQLDLNSFPEENHSCIDSIHPSVVMSNSITAGLMIGEMIHALNNNDFHIEKPIHYSSSFPARIYVEKDRIRR